MDLNRLTNEQKLDLCRKYFKIGILFLPFVWAVNTIWFFKEAFRKPMYEEQKLIKKYVLLSAAGSLMWLILLIAWIAVFQLNRVSWGHFGEDISFIIPVGRA